MGALASFGDELDAFRAEAGLSYRALAVRCGVSAAHLCNLARGRRGVRVTDAVIVAVARGLELPADAFQEYRHRRLLERFPGQADELYVSLTATSTRAA